MGACLAHLGSRARAQLRAPARPSARDPELFALPASQRALRGHWRTPPGLPIAAAPVPASCSPEAPRAGEHSDVAVVRKAAYGVCFYVRTPWRQREIGIALSDQKRRPRSLAPARRARLPTAISALAPRYGPIVRGPSRRFMSERAACQTHTAEFVNSTR